jgi:diguanylate cyclase (GGDEF)-like protein
MPVARAVQRVREFTSSVDGSLLDDSTWQRRHDVILGIAWALTLFAVGFTLVDPKAPHRQWLYVLVSVACLVVARSGRLSRRKREVLTTVALASAEFYTVAFIGNFTLGPLSVILITFYQDWLPIFLGCLYIAVVALLAWVDPSLFHTFTALRPEVPHTGMTLRAAAIFLSVPLSFAVWRAGTQLGRDQLTGMLSRAGAEHALDREMGHGRRPAVWICDVDNFRAVNRHLGSDEGDQLLKHVGRRLSGLARRQEGSWFCARLGGDTFLMAARHAPDDNFIHAFAHSVEADTGLATGAIGKDGLRVRLSVGAAAAVIGEDGAGLVRAAERNMLQAKGRGLLRVVVDERPERAVERAAPLLNTELHRACERGELELYLQPIMRLSDGMPVGAEMLVRWNHPDRGLVFPDQFLTAAENDSGLMAVLGNHLGSQFLQIAGDFIDRRGLDWLSYGYSYNLAASRLRDPTLPKLIAGNLIAAGLHDTGGVLHLEVTEGALMDIEHGAPEVLATLRAAGYRIALDDFGTGHSSLAHLRDFPLDTVKIDKAFVQSMDQSAIDRAVVQAVADIASASGLGVVAEGVETEQQRMMLLAIRPDILAQGWLYAKAMPVDEFEAWVDAHKRAAVA